MQENMILKTAQFELALISGCSDEEHQCDVTIEQVLTYSALNKNINIGVR